MRSRDTARALLKTREEACMARRPQFGEFSMKYEGKTYNARFYVQEGMITVRMAGVQKSTQLGGLRLKVLANMLLTQLIRTGEADL
jgi:hypothetical protein